MLNDTGLKTVPYVNKPAGLNKAMVFVPERVFGCGSLVLFEHKKSRARAKRQ